MDKSGTILVCFFFFLFTYSSSIFGQNSESSEKDEKRKLIEQYGTQELKQKAERGELDLPEETAEDLELSMLIMGLVESSDPTQRQSFLNSLGVKSSTDQQSVKASEKLLMAIKQKVLMMTPEEKSSLRQKLEMAQLQPSNGPENVGQADKGEGVIAGETEGMGSGSEQIPSVADIEALQKSGKYSEAMVLMGNQLRQYDDQMIGERIMSRFKGKAVGNYLQEHPQILAFFIRLLKDEKALPQMAKIIEDRPKLLKFGIMNLVLILLGWALGKFVHRNGGSFFQGLKRSVFLSLSLWGVRIGLLIYFYGQELSPIFYIVKSFVGQQLA